MNGSQLYDQWLNMPVADFIFNIEKGETLFSYCYDAVEELNYCSIVFAGNEEIKAIAKKIETYVSNYVEIKDGKYVAKEL